MSDESALITTAAEATEAVKRWYDNLCTANPGIVYRAPETFDVLTQTLFAIATDHFVLNDRPVTVEDRDLMDGVARIRREEP